MNIINNQQTSESSTTLTHSLKNRLRKWVIDIYHRIYPYLPPLKSRKFWIAQGLVVVIAIMHDVIEIGGHLDSLHVLYFVPVSLFLLPVIYAAINFGFSGAMATSLWAIIITIPNWVFWHDGLERLGVIFQMSILVAVAILMGNRVDRENRALQQAKDASNAARVYASHVLQAQEKERKRIARELHDETIQMLALLYQQLSNIESSNPYLPPTVVKEMKESQRIAEQAMKELREFTRSIRPPILDDLGMIPSIRRLLIDLIKHTGIKHQFRLIGKERRLAQDIEVAIFRIAQEAIWNVKRHSKATEVMVTITLDKEEVRLRISDNGVGFDVPPMLNGFIATGSLGLLGMQERAELIDGKLEIYSDPRMGTSIVFSIHIS
jgi:signal transduction histidine kinase